MTILFSNTLNGFLIDLLEIGIDLIIIIAIQVVFHFVSKLLELDEKTNIAINIIFLICALIWNFLPVHSSMLIGAMLYHCYTAYQIIFKKTDTENMAEYNDAIAQDPNNAEAYFNRASAKYDLGDNVGSILDFNKAIEINPDDADAFYNRSLAKYDQGDNEGCISDNNRAIEIDPEYGDAYYMRGLAKNNLNDLEGARLDWSKAGELGVTEAYQAIRQHATIHSN
jgi:tetratricopeptide (TPR) repeat protein